MSVGAAQVSVEPNITIVDSVYEFFYELFLKGSLDIPPNSRSLDVIEALNHKSVKADGDLIKFTYKGIKEFRDEYAKRVESGIVEEGTLKFFGCLFAERTRESFDGPAIFVSSEPVKEFVKFLGIASELSISDKSCAVDYAVLDFIDSHTGETHYLYPGDTVVMVDKGYVVHKFSE